MVMTTPLKKLVRSDNRQAADADDVHLQRDVIAVVRRAENIVERLARQRIEILNRQDRRFQEIEQSKAPMNPMLPC